MRDSILITRTPQYKSQLFQATVLWELFLLTSSAGDLMLEDFLHFKAGSSKEAIWQWFETTFPYVGLHKIAHGNNTKELKQIIDNKLNKHGSFIKKEIALDVDTFTI